MEQDERVDWITLYNCDQIHVLYYDFLEMVEKNDKLKKDNLDLISALNDAHRELYERTT